VTSDSAHQDNVANAHTARHALEHYSARAENEERADRARHALENWLVVAGIKLPDEHTGDDDYLMWLSDLVTDLFHLADQHNAEPEKIVEWARWHYADEVARERRQEASK
jgi:hypothetical protein